MDHIIGVDHGYAATKTANFAFPSGVVAFDTCPPVQSGLLEIEGKYFVIGTGRQPLLKNKTANENYRMLTYAAIARELYSRTGCCTGSILLAAGLPLTSYGRERAGFKAYLMASAQPTRFRFEGQEYEITIKDVEIYPQGFSAIANNAALLEGEPSTLVVDIGGWTVDIMRLDRFTVDTASCRSLELGVIRCMDEIKEQVRRTVGLSVTDAQVENILTGQPCTLDKQATELILRHGRLYVERLLSAIEECGFDLKALPVIFMGGGASLVKPRVTAQDRLCRAEYLTDVGVNAKAFEAILSRKVRA
ncbi:ParM/StbA family protein [Christensenellaceae bacterium OttesenSCG-928-M15]|nr:ParM/StbA family protein [Christensenellaceae bacterium OttesenSCG-928-M15]